MSRKRKKSKSKHRAGFESGRKWHRFLADPVPARASLDNTYEVHSLLMAGDYPGEKPYYPLHSAFTHLLVEKGVGLFIDLTESHEKSRRFYSRVRHYDRDIGGSSYMNAPIVDDSIPTAAKMVEILDAIDEAHNQGVKVYVHCRGGVGRTGLVVGCHIARRFGVSGKEALDILRTMWKDCAKSRTRRSPSTMTQEEFVEKWPEIEMAWLTRGEEFVPTRVQKPMHDLWNDYFQERYGSRDDSFYGESWETACSSREIYAQRRF